MGRATIFDRVKEFIGGLCFRIFLRSVGMTDEEYWHEIWEQEESNREADHEQD